MLHFCGCVLFYVHVHISMHIDSYFASLKFLKFNKFYVV
jgi:hypothetical protein